VYTTTKQHRCEHKALLKTDLVCHQHADLHLLQANPSPRTEAPHSAASAASCGQDWWPQTQLVGLSAPRVRSRSITEVMAIAQTQQQQQLSAGLGQALATGGGSGNLSKL
jgi:hypothetical protein